MALKASGPAAAFLWVTAAVALALGALPEAASAQDTYPEVTARLVSPSFSLGERLSRGVTVNLDRVPEREVWVDWEVTHHGGADASDYSIFPSYFYFPANRRVQFVIVTATDDDLDDDCESVELSLVPRSAGVVGGGTLTISIRDDDGETVDCTTGGGGGPLPPAPPPEPEPEPEPPPPPEAPTAAFAVEGVTCDAELCRAVTGASASFEDTSSGTVVSRHWDFGDGNTSRSSTPEHAWSSPGFYEVSLTVSGAGAESTASRVFLVEAADPAGSCEPDGETICLQDSRYQVRATWRSPAGELLPARAARAGTNDSGLLWFHDAENWEALVKVLDGCSINGADWVFAASATTLGFDIEVADTVTGEVREYGNEPGRQAPAITDTDAFTDRCAHQGAHAGRSTASGAGKAGGDGPAAADARALPSSTLLDEGRFEVAVEWSTADGRRGEALPARAGTPNSGVFWFFEPDNWEVLIKVLDGCGFNGNYWVYAASATDVGLDIAVTDTTTGDVRRYTKSPGAPAPALADSAAFPDSCR